MNMIDIASKTRKYLDEIVEKKRKKTGDVSVVDLKEVLKKAITKYREGKIDFEFLSCLCGDIYLELCVNTEEDWKLYSMVEYLMKQDNKKPSNKVEKEIEKLEKYLS